MNYYSQKTATVSRQYLGGDCPCKMKTPCRLSYPVKTGRAPQGYQDQVRHQHKIREVIKRNLPDLITEENIILSDGKQIIKVPIRALTNTVSSITIKSKSMSVRATATVRSGTSLDATLRQPSPVRENRPAIRQGRTSWKPRSAWKSWRICCLRNWSSRRAKDKEQIETESIVFNDIRKRHHVQHRQETHHLGEFAPQCKRRQTRHPRDQSGRLALQDLGRHRHPGIQCGHYRHDGYVRLHGLLREILRARFLLDDPLPSQAVREGRNRVYRPPYRGKEVTEEEFFTRGESGGTICSSAYQKALDIIHHRYPFQIQHLSLPLLRRR